MTLHRTVSKWLELAKCVYVPCSTFFPKQNQRNSILHQQVLQQSNTMAFMMPVVKNDWDIYKSKRNRRVSECSNPSSCRSRKVSECKSEGPSLSTSPGNEFHAPPPPPPVPSSCKSVPSNMSKQNYSRTSSRNSEGSLQSPIKSSTSSPPKSDTDSDSSLSTFHCRLLDKLKKSLKSKDGDSERTSS